MTLAEIKKSDKPMLTPADVAKVLGCDAQSIRNNARKDSKQLGFPVIVMGRRTLIPRKAFLHYLGELQTDEL